MISKEAKVGIFIITGLLAFSLIVVLVEDIELGAKRKIYVKFDDTSGLPPKAQIRIAYVKVGTVQSVRLVDGKARVIAYLDSKLPGRRKNQRAALSLGKALNNRNGKGKCLAGAGLRNSYNIFVFYGNGYGFMLNRCRRSKLHSIQYVQYSRGNPKAVKCYVWLFWYLCHYSP